MYDNFYYSHERFSSSWEDWHTVIAGGKFPFGKYKGDYFTEVAQDNEGNNYCCWFIQEIEPHSQFYDLREALLEIVCHSIPFQFFQGSGVYAALGMEHWKITSVKGKLVFGQSEKGKFCLVVANSLTKDNLPSYAQLMRKTKRKGLRMVLTCPAIAHAGETEYIHKVIRALGFELVVL